MPGWEIYLGVAGCVALATCVQNLTGFAFGLVLLGLVSSAPPHGVVHHHLAIGLRERRQFPHRQQRQHGLGRPAQRDRWRI